MESMRIKCECGRAVFVRLHEAKDVNGTALPKPDTDGAFTSANASGTTAVELQEE